MDASIARMIAKLRDALPITEGDARRLRRIVIETACEGLARDGVLTWDRLGTFRVVEAVGSPSFRPIQKYSTRFRVSRSALECINHSKFAP